MRQDNDGVYDIPLSPQKHLLDLYRANFRLYRRIGEGASITMRSPHGKNRVQAANSAMVLFCSCNAILTLADDEWYQWFSWLSGCRYQPGLGHYF